MAPADSRLPAEAISARARFPSACFHLARAVPMIRAMEPRIRVVDSGEGGNSTLQSLTGIVTLVAWGILTWFGWQFVDPPSPRPVDAPASQFSAGRANEVLGRLAGDEQPRPLASEASAAARERLLGELRT